MKLNTYDAASGRRKGPGLAMLRGLPVPLRLFLFVNLGLTGVCSLVEAVCARRGLSYIYCSPYFRGVPYLDYTCFESRFHELHHAAFFDASQPFLFTYPAPAAVIYQFFYKVGGYSPVGFFLAVYLLSTLTVVVCYARSLFSHGLPSLTSTVFAAVTAAVAFPIWFGLQRGNIEFVPCLFIGAGLYAFVSRRGYTAATCFAIAASIKIMPIVYLGLFLPRRQYRQLLWGLGVAASVSIASLEFLGPSLPVALRGIGAGLYFFELNYMLHLSAGSLSWDHSLLSMFRVFTGVSPSLLSRYTLATGVGGLALFLLRIVRLPFINQVLCLSVAAVWLVPVSFEYTLISLYGVSILLALASLRLEGSALARANVVMALLAILFSPLSELIYAGYQLGGQVKCLVLCVAFFYGLIRPIPSRYDLPSEAIPGSPFAGTDRVAQRA